MKNVLDKTSFSLTTDNLRVIFQMCRISRAWGYFNVPGNNDARQLMRFWSPIRNYTPLPVRWL